MCDSVAIWESRPSWFTPAIRTMSHVPLQLRKRHNHQCEFPYLYIWVKCLLLELNEHTLDFLDSPVPKVVFHKCVCLNFRWRKSRSSMLTTLASLCQYINISPGESITWQHCNERCINFEVRKTSVQIPTDSPIISGIFSKFLLLSLCYRDCIDACTGVWVFKPTELHVLNTCSSLIIDHTPIKLFEK